MTKPFWKWSLRIRRKKTPVSNLALPFNEYGPHSEPEFRKKLLQERKRAERSNKPVILALVTLEEGASEAHGYFANLCEQLTECVRETDTCGYLKADTVLGIILTEVAPEMVESAKRAVTKKIRTVSEQLVQGSKGGVQIIFKVFPDREGGEGGRDPVWYPDVVHEGFSSMEVAKRTMDVAGSLLGLIIFSPIFLLVPIIIRMSSKGPAFFFQQRVGCNGITFNLVKFRSMYLNNDDIMHRTFVTALIRNKSASSPCSVYKIQSDPRVTPVGRLLRKYSVDELPQFINVLKGEMSLVGPRPPILYEVEHYFPWQLCRVMGRRPGITGLWQVTGRSTTGFDDMVRLDLRYLRNWSLKMDIKLLLMTPAAVLKCKGAY